MTQQKNTPLAAFVETIKAIDRPTINEEVPSDHIDALYLVALYDTRDDLTNKKELHLGYKERAYVRHIAKHAFALIALEHTDPTEAQYTLNRLLHTLDQIGIKRDTLPFLPPANEVGQSDDEQLELTHRPTVLDEFAAAIETIEEGEGRWTMKESHLTVDTYLHGYQRLQSFLDSRALSGELKLDAIATNNAFGHALGVRLSKMDPINAESTIKTIEDDIVSAVVASEDFSDERIPEVLRYRQNRYREGDLPEISTFRQAVLKGIRIELLTCDEIRRFMPDVANVEFSSVENDILLGYDLVVTTTSGEVYYIDTKSRGSFLGATSKKDVQTIGDSGSGVALKRSREPNGPTVIMIDAESLGGITYDKNRYRVTDSERLCEGITAGMQAIDAHGS